VRSTALLLGASLSALAACAPYTATGDGQKTAPVVTRGRAEPPAAAPAPIPAPGVATPPPPDPIGRRSTLLAGSVAFSSGGGEAYADAEGNRFVQWDLYPTVQHFVARGVAVGGAIGISSVSQGETSASIYGIGPRVSYFIGPRHPAAPARGTPLPFLGLGLLWTRIAADDGFVDVSGSGLTLSLGGGVAFMVSESVALLAEAAYHIDHLTVEDQSANGNRVSLQLGIAGFLR
jgi:hypothetical protein